jgi:hypothetical protein
MNASIRYVLTGMVLAGTMALVCPDGARATAATNPTTVLSSGGNLTDNNGQSNTWRPGHRYKLYTFQAQNDRTYVIDVRSGNGIHDGTPNFFDTYIFLLDPTGKMVAYNDDYGGTLNSHIRYGTPRSGGAGTYTVVVTTYSMEAQGNFNISVVQDD